MATEYRRRTSAPRLDDRRSWCYGIFDLDRLERMVLRNIATEYFVAPADDEETPDGEDDDEG